MYCKGFADILTAILNGKLDSFGIFQGLGNLVIFHSILAAVLLIALLVLAYIIPCYVLMYQGRKTGLENDWFAYVPIVHSIYRMDMVREDRWKIFFIGGVSTFIKYILVFFIALITINGGSSVVLIMFDVILLAYCGACMTFKYLYDRKFFAVFGYNSELALIGLAASLASLCLVVIIAGGFMGLGAFIISVGTMGISTCYTMLIILLTLISTGNLYYTVVNLHVAFDDRVAAGGVSSTAGAVYSEPTDGRVPPVSRVEGQLVCTGGMYKDAVFTLENNFEIIIGRDSYYASIVITEGSSSISRKHCGIRYDIKNRCYIVTDYSSNGTFTSSGERLQRNVAQSFPSGTTICLGDKKNRFKLV